MESIIETESMMQKLNQDDDDHQPGNGNKLLPHEVAVEIASRLPVTSLIQLRFVSKILCNLTRDPLLVQMHLFRAKKSNPYLILHCGYTQNSRLHLVEFSEHDHTQKVRQITTPFSNSMPRFNVVGSCDGLLCLADYSLASDAVYYVYNPFTGQYRELPKSVQFLNQEVVYGFGSHPITKEYKLVKIIYYSDPNSPPRRSPGFRIIRYEQASEVRVFSLGGVQWRSVGEMPYQLDRDSTGVLVDGRLHWVSENAVPGGLIISFDISDETFREVPLPNRQDRVALVDYHLAVLGGCLSLVTASGSLDVWIMREYSVKESWVRQFRIGDYSAKLMAPEFRHSYGIWSPVILCTRIVRVLCMLNNGEILVEYRGGTLASYNPESGRFKKITLPGMPSLFKAFSHVGSLNWID